jgi:hypothetical protein
MQKLLIVCPHLSTGGSGQVTANKIELIKDKFDIKVVEYNFHSNIYVVQRNRIINLVGNDNFISLGDNKEQLIELVELWQPDVISMEEFPEMFMHEDIATKIYSRQLFGGKHEIIETTHDSSFNMKLNKIWKPDRYIFVSPYNALKLIEAKINVPYEIIEYPVDETQREGAWHSNALNQLNLDYDYVHVVVIGLFTPRKNQKYVFQLAEFLKDYKIQFHFIGNQAENFAFYWKPLMENKPENCIIWGERDDTQTFINACDLFLFASMGDRNNKELNPIVIKEACSYSNMPKLLFNLDVYLNRYNEDESFHFLTNDIFEDSKKIISITRPSKISNKEELIIIGTYPNLQSRVQLTKDTIHSLKPLNRKIMLVSHYPVDEEIQRLVDYYIYDAENLMTHHSYYTRFYNYTNNYDVEININGIKNTNQSLAVFTNIMNGAKAAQSLGYTSFFYSTYDVVIDTKDYPIIEEGFKAITDWGEEITIAYLNTLKTPFLHGIQTNGMFFDTQEFIKIFSNPSIKTEIEYNADCQKIGSQNFLEDYLMKKLQGHPSVKFGNPEQETLLVHSGMGVASNSEYYSIIPVDKKENVFMFYFFTYNIDDRKVNVSIENGGVEWSDDWFTISKQREYKKEIVYNGMEIVVTISFYDGEKCYKHEHYLINNSNIHKYKNTGFYKNKNQKPSIKIVHIQTTNNDEKEQKSRQSFQKIKDYGMDYVIHINEPYKDLPPKFNCQRPQCVSMDLFTEQQIQQYGTALTPSHYGCYDSFRTAILSEFDNDIDFLIVCEGDCIIEVPTKEFTDKVFKACQIIDDNNVGYFSFGDTKTLEHGWLQSPVIETIANQDLLFITNHIIGLQCIMFPKKVRKYLFEKLKTHKWDAADMYFNSIFNRSQYKMGILHNRITTQADGFSLIDNQTKKFI